MKTCSKLLRFAALAVGLTSCLSARAQQTESKADETVVVLDKFQVTVALGRYAETTSSAGSKLPMAIKDLPNSLQVINASFIEDRKALTLDDIYPFVTGLSREAATSNGFTLRGFSNSGAFQQNIQIDGLPGLASRWGSPSTANVDRVEVLKGPASVLYGQINPGGIINVVSKRPQGKRAATLSTSVSSFAGERSELADDVSFTASADVTAPLTSNGKWLYRAIAHYESLQSFRRNIFAKGHSFFPSLTFQPDENTTLTLLFELTRQHRAWDDGLAAPFGNVALVAPRDLVYQEKTDREYDSGEVASLDFKHHFADKWTLQVNARGVWHEDGRRNLESNNVTSVTPVTNSTLRRRYRDQLNFREYFFLDAHLRAEFETARLKHTPLLGFYTGYELQDFRRLAFGPFVPNINLFTPALGTTAYPANPAIPVSVIQTEYNNYDVYASDQVQLGKRWHASLGARYSTQESNLIDTVTGRTREQSVSSTVPWVGLVHQPNEHLSVYASYSESYRPASVDAVDANGNNGFDAESGNQVEVGVKGEYAEGRISFGLAAYSIKKTNVIETTGAFLPDGSAISRLVGEQTSEGFEFEGAWLPRPHWQIQAGYAYMDATVTKSLNASLLGASLVNTPRHSGSFWTRYNVPEGRLKGLGFGLGVIYQGERHGVISNDPAAYIGLPGYTRYDGALFYAWRRYRVSLNIANLTDEEYFSGARTQVTVIPGEPRKLTLLIRRSF
jgi:iron complex outermembrane receptor protein